jgi:phosphohistidine phosphatase
MDLLLVRSACAEVPVAGAPDARRALTPRGRRRARRVARVLARMGMSRPRLLHSPRLRALETADVLQKRLGGEGVASAALTAPPGPALLAQMTGECVVLVGHEPWLGRLVTWLVVGAPGKAPLRLKRGGVAWLEGKAQPGAMRLRAVIPPQVLRKFARRRGGRRRR